jgi:hypothetical protein
MIANWDEDPRPARPARLEPAEEVFELRLRLMASLCLNAVLAIIVFCLVRHHGFIPHQITKR